tara:strand:- start:1000 stop:1173 length:174 start_codon:yes stop_codon:yes gene_type:complete
MRILLLLFVSFFMTNYTIASTSNYVLHHHNEAEVVSSCDLVFNEADEDAEEEEPECD